MPEHPRSGGPLAPSGPHIPPYTPGSNAENAGNPLTPFLPTWARTILGIVAFVMALGQLIDVYIVHPRTTVEEARIVAADTARPVARNAIASIAVAKTDVQVLCAGTACENTQFRLAATPGGASTVLLYRDLGIPAGSKLMDTWIECRGNCQEMNAFASIDVHPDVDQQDAVQVIALSAPNGNGLVRIRIHSMYLPPPAAPTAQ